MKHHSLIALVAASLLAAGCTRQVGLTYTPTQSLAPVPAQGSVGTVTAFDGRGERDPTWIGAVRGGYGNPVKVLHTPRPLDQEIVTAFQDALKARGLLAPAGAGTADVAVTIKRFQASQVARREADVDLLLIVTLAGTGREVYRDEVAVNPVTGSILALDTGLFGSSDDLQAALQAAMNDAIDKLLSKPGFLAALR